MPILTDQERIGTTIGDGKYTLERVLGRGGMGTVFEAIHTWTGRHVAVKLLLNEMALDVDASHRFLQEARSATAIEHPNVVEVLDMGRHDDASVYMVFELLRGESLADRLEENGPLDTMQTAMILLPVADALAAAHRLGIVHRDVKPDNIFLEDDGMGYVRPKLLDFGIACFSERRGGVASPGVIMGTPGYLSPEHAQGFQAGPASDVWSLGVVLFECITGYCPFESESLTGAILAIASRPIPSLRERLDVPEPIARLVESTLVRNPVARFPDGAAFRDALAAASQVEFVPSRSRSVPPKIVRDSDELSLSSAHRVEVRQSSPAPALMPSGHEPPPVRVRPATPLLLVSVDAEAVTRRIDPERGGARSVVDAAHDDDLDELEASALFASLLPRWGRWRRAAMFALAPLLLFLVPTVAYRPTQPGGIRAEGGVVTVAAAAPDTSAPPSDVGSPASSWSVVAHTAGSADGSSAPPILAATGGDGATEARAHSRDRWGSGSMEAVDAGPQAVDAGTEPVDAGTWTADAGTEPVDEATLFDARN